jgi:hypothetical protein
MEGMSFTTPEQPVVLGVSYEVLRRMLRLPEEMRLVDVRGDEWRQVAELMVVTAQAPKGAYYMDPTYHQDPIGWPDPIQLLRVDWFDADRNPVEPS